MGNENFEEIISILLRAIENLPEPVQKRIKGDFLKLKELTLDSRSPRILIVGRRGAGKSSLINSIFREKVAEVGSVKSETGQATWHSFQNEMGAVEILDTRGIGDRTKPESANFANAIEEIQNAVSDCCPDVLMFLCKGKDVDSHVTEDVKSVALISEFVEKKHKYSMPIFAVVTQVDELDPKRVDPPFESEEKQKNIGTAVKAISDAFREENIKLMNVIPTSAYAEYDDGILGYNSFWNIEKLTEYIIEQLPLEAQLQFARVSAIKEIQIRIGRVVTGTAASLAAGVAWTPIPVADILPITAIQVSMIASIGYIAGREFSKETAREFLVALGVNVGVGFALREATRALVKYLFPGGGNVISAGMAFAATWGIGEAAIAYFIEEKSIEEARETLGREKSKRLESGESPA